jgi:multiple sugar transport system permease protein
MKRRDRPFLAAKIVLAAALVTATIFPLAWIILTGFKAPAEVISRPPRLLFSPSLENFDSLFRSEDIPFQRYFMNSLVITTTSTAVSIVIATLAGYALARLLPRAKAIALAILGARMLPPIGLVVPIYLIVSSLRLLDTRIALIVPYVALNIPLATWMMRSYFLDLPKDLEEAAEIDGCGRFSTFLLIFVPLAAPGIAATAIFSFILAWNEFLLALPLTTSQAVPLPIVASRVRVEEGILWGRLGAITTILLAPVVVFTLFTQKYLVSGLTAGSVKG